MLVGLGVLDMVEGEKHMIVGTKRKEDLGVVTKTKQKKWEDPTKPLVRIFVFCAWSMGNQLIIFFFIAPWRLGCSIGYFS